MASTIVAGAAVLGALSLAAIALSVVVSLYRWQKTLEPRRASARGEEPTEDGGSTGNVGSKGNNGPTGNEGSTGNQSSSGNNGSTGNKGSSGNHGSTENQESSATAEFERTAAESSGRPPAVEAALLSEKLRAYRDISDAVIALNREALTLDETVFREAADSIALDQQSPLEEQYLDVNAAYESNLYLIDDAVRSATSKYVDYLATYHEEGAHAGGLLGRAGDVYEAMRSDLGLESLYDEESAPRRHETEETEPMPPETEVEDFSEELGRPEDLDYFSPRDSEKGETDDAVDERDRSNDGAM